MAKYSWIFDLSGFGATLALFWPRVALLGALAAVVIAAVAALVARRADGARRRAARAARAAHPGPGRPLGSRNKPLPAANEAIDQEIARYWRDLWRHDRAEYRAIVGAEARRRLMPGAGEAGEMTVDTVLAAMEVLKRLGMIVVPADGRSAWVDAAGKVAPYLPEMVANYLAGTAPAK